MRIARGTASRWSTQGKILTMRCLQGAHFIQDLSDEQENETQNTEAVRSGKKTTLPYREQWGCHGAKCHAQAPKAEVGP